MKYTTYCEKCGTVPGATHGQCPVNGPNLHKHIWRSMDNRLVYCEKCGAAPGSIHGKCPVDGPNSHEHIWVKEDK